MAGLDEMAWQRWGQLELDGPRILKGKPPFGHRQELWNGRAPGDEGTGASTAAFLMSHIV